MKGKDMKMINYRLKRAGSRKRPNLNGKLVEKKNMEEGGHKREVGVRQ